MTLAVGARLLRFPKLLFQLLHQLLKALGSDSVIGFVSHPLGLFKPSLQFVSVALFIHGDTPSSVRRGRGAMVHATASSFRLVVKGGYLSVKLPKLNIVSDR